MELVLTKHQALGNDFLVFDMAQGLPRAALADLARRWCDRRFGIGADGLLVLTNHGERRLSMELYNADGSRAEISGNGIRCLVQAAYESDQRAAGIDQPGSERPGVTYEVVTDAGVRLVEVVSDDGVGTIQASVDMGRVDDLPVPMNWEVLGCQPDRPVAHVSLGNPHSVVAVDDVSVVPLKDLGAQVPHVNLEIVEPGPEANAITMRVHERGAGITLACGSGACASAYAAKMWGLVPASVAEVLVHMEGGDAKVRIDATSRVATLIGPSQFVANVSVRA